MLINQAAWRRDDFGSTCFTATEVHGDFDGSITSLNATDAVLETFALQSLLSSFCSWFVIAMGGAFNTVSVNSSVAYPDTVFHAEALQLFQ